MSRGKTKRAATTYHLGTRVQSLYNETKLIERNIRKLNDKVRKVFTTVTLINDYLERKEAEKARAADAEFHINRGRIDARMEQSKANYELRSFLEERIKKLEARIAVLETRKKADGQRSMSGLNESLMRTESKAQKVLPIYQPKPL